MSPLARPLLALVALLVAATDGNNNCVTKVVGQVTQYPLEAIHEIPYGKNTEDYRNVCHPYKRLGESIMLCNKNENNRESGNIDGPTRGQLMPVNITCPDPRGCDLSYVFFCEHR